MIHIFVACELRCTAKGVRLKKIYRKAIVIDISTNFIDAIILTILKIQYINKLLILEYKH